MSSSSSRRPPAAPPPTLPYLRLVEPVRSTCAQPRPGSGYTLLEDRGYCVTYAGPIGTCVSAWQDGHIALSQSERAQFVTPSHQAIRHAAHAFGLEHWVARRLLQNVVGIYPEPAEVVRSVETAALAHERERASKR